MKTRGHTDAGSKGVLPRASLTATRVVQAAVCAWLLGAVPVHVAVGQQAAPTALAANADAAREDMVAEGWHLEQCMAGITYGAPLKLAVAYGGGFLYESNSRPDWCALVVAKIGLGGAQASTGIGTSFAPWGSGVMLTANVLRTFSSPLGATASRNYIGASLHVWPLLALGGELGYYTRMGDKDGESSAGKNIVAWSFGFGF